jgi:hypothetical protein
MHPHTERRDRSLAVPAARVGIILVVCGSFWYGIAELMARLTA